MRTQISGKYSEQNPELFEFRDRLVDAGFDVEFPRGERILSDTGSFVITVAEEATVPFYKAELNFLRSVQRNAVHVVHNVNGQTDGYIGESVSVEIAYAALSRKPVFLTRVPAYYSESVKPELKELLESRYKHMHVATLDNMRSADIRDTISASLGEQDYGLSVRDEELVMGCVYDLTQEYRRYWHEFNQSVS